MTGDLRGRLQAILERHVSSINARTLVERAMRACGTDSIELADIDPLVASIRPSLRLFAGATAAAAVTADLRALASVVAEDIPDRVELLREEDIAAARNLARRYCGAAGAQSFATLRVLTVVSELARNIVSYSHGGYLEFKTTPGCIHLFAADRGPGIGNLEEILGGRYRSKTGMGLGILGVKRTASHFAIDTSPKGTWIEATVSL
jgi:serine/threonine-protein kinase RsbT